MNYKWIVNDNIPNNLYFETIKEIINLKIARIILESERNNYDNN